MKTKVRNVLDKKEREYELAVDWFKYNYDPVNTDDNELGDREKEAIELLAQIKILKFILES